MGLHAQVCGRVGRCRDLINRYWGESRNPKPVVVLITPGFIYWCDKPELLTADRETISDVRANRRASRRNAHPSTRFPRESILGKLTNNNYGRHEQTGGP